MILLRGVGRRALVAGLAAGAGLGKPARADGLPPIGALLPSPGREMPAIGWTTADGAKVALADLAGRGLVLNLWATWCVPCVAEMPALDALADAVRDAKVLVLPLSSDRGGAVAVRRFYEQRGIRHLDVVLDPRGDAARALGARGIPTTVLVDAAGRERGRVEGAADWSSAAAIEAVKGLAAG